MPETVSGLMYCWYWPYTAPPNAVMAAEITVTVSLVRVTWMPSDAAASSSWLIASMA